MPHNWHLSLFIPQTTPNGIIFRTEDRPTKRQQHTTKPLSNRRPRRGLNSYPVYTIMRLHKFIHSIPQGSAKNPHCLQWWWQADFQRPSSGRIVSFFLGWWLTAAMQWHSIHSLRGGPPVSNRTSSGNFIAIITITLNYFTGTSLFLHLSFCHTWVCFAAASRKCWLVGWPRLAILSGLEPRGWSGLAPCLE